ncbi:hypothetical protein ACFLYA_02900 [Candidatus Dependentiae bacterium]
MAKEKDVALVTFKPRSLEDIKERFEFIIKEQEQKKKEEESVGLELF